eukprot:2063239-Amphidinium_carterae.1
MKSTSVEDDFAEDDDNAPPPRSGRKGKYHATSNAVPCCMSEAVCQEPANKVVLDSRMSPRIVWQSPLPTIHRPDTQPSSATMS